MFACEGPHLLGVGLVVVVLLGDAGALVGVGNLIAVDSSNFPGTCTVGAMVLGSVGMVAIDVLALVGMHFVVLVLECVDFVVLVPAGSRH